MQSPQEFYTDFRASRTAIAAQLDELDNNAIHTNPESVAHIAQSIQFERKKLNEATSYLPSYDRRSYESQLQELESRIDVLRSKNAPAKGKFVFKKKSTTSTRAPVPPREEQNPTPSESPHIPISVQTPVSPPDLTSSTPNLQIKSSSYEHFTFSSLSQPTSPSSLPTDLTITGLDHCFVDLLPQDPSAKINDGTEEHGESEVTEDASANPSPPILTAIHIRDVKNTVLLLGHVRGSVLAINLSHCVVVLACHQLRVHTSHNTSFHLHVSSNAIIEDSNSLTFGPYPTSLPLPPEIRQQKSTHHTIQDFSHLKPTPSPHWSAANPTTNSTLDATTKPDPWTALRTSLSPFPLQSQAASTIQPKGEADEDDQKKEKKDRLTSLLAKILPHQ